MAFRIEHGAEPIPGYKLLERLGSGGFGEVWKAEAPGGIFKAIKFIHGDLRDKHNDDIRFAEQELKALKRVQAVRHPYLLSLDRYDIVEGRLMITMELADCNLWDRFRVFRQQGHPGIPRDELLRYIIESAEVLDLMNDRYALQHLDIKPQNLFLLHSHVKVADFGQVKDLQGMGAQVTGGITPVYAAPETFDGFVSRFCDQYSLACVYQELLTGQRPFDGTSMQQLLTQHLSHPPNLGPVPSSERPAMARALAKKPDERFPNITAFARALMEVGHGTTSRSAVLTASPASAEFDPSTRIRVSLPESEATSSVVAMTHTARPQGGSEIISGYPPLGVSSGASDTPVPTGGLETQLPLICVAPPEVKGAGPLRPTLIVGLGGVGQQVLRAFRKRLLDRYGNPDSVPMVRTLYIDTDPAAVESATSDRTTPERPPLPADSTYLARLSRPGHYMKPRMTGRPVTDGWFDPMLLYRLPRAPVTMGIRAFGRLAFCDHYRPLTQKILAELATVVSPEATADSCSRTGLDLRTNRPRVYVVAGLAGGTGGGMALDVAYTVRAKLKQLGYASPEVVGVLMLPPDVPMDQINPLVQANVYAALTELNHFTKDDTVFNAQYDDRYGSVSDSQPPFAELVMMPGPIGAVPKTMSGVIRDFPRPMPGLSGIVPMPTGRHSSVMKAGHWSPNQRSGSAAIAVPTALASHSPDAGNVADLLWYDLFTPLGTTAEEARGARDRTVGTTVRTAGTVRISWPRGDVLARSSYSVTLVLLDGWLSPDARRARGPAPEWAQETWSSLGLEIDSLTQKFGEVAGQVAQARMEDLLGGMCVRLAPKGWRARLPDENRVAAELNRLTQLVGCPLTAINVVPPVQAAVRQASGKWEKSLSEELTRRVTGLLDDPAFRLAGAEDVVRSLLGIVNRNATQLARRQAESADRARADYDVLTQLVNSQKGMPKPAAAEFNAAVKNYPQSRYQAVLYRQILDLYAHIKTSLSQLLADLGQLRTSFDAARAKFASDRPSKQPPRGPRDLLPEGCETVAEAIKRFLASLTDQDLLQIETRFQTAVTADSAGVYHACTRSPGGADGVVARLLLQTREYLTGRVGGVDLCDMFARSYPTPDEARTALSAAYDEATPQLVDPGPWSRRQLVVVACPPGQAGESLRNVAASALPPGDSARTIDIEDEVSYYREYPAVPMTALPQLGTTWESAYKALQEATQCSPHSRNDVAKWADVNSG